MDVLLSPTIRLTARAMRFELESRRLSVELAPSRVPQVAARGGKIRVVTETNPAWYRDFCAAYPKSRRKPRRRNKPDTKIRRGLTLRALQELEDGRCHTTYAQRLLPFVRAQARRWQQLEADWRRRAHAHSPPRCEPAAILL